MGELQPGEHHPIPVLVFAKGRWQKSLVSIPQEWRITHLNLVYSMGAIRAARTVPWEDRENKIFWRGGTTTHWHCDNYFGGEKQGVEGIADVRCRNLSMTPDVHWDLQSWDTAPRSRIVLLGSFLPDLVDAKFTQAWDPWLDTHLMR